MVHGVDLKQQSTLFTITFNIQQVSRYNLNLQKYKGQSAPAISLGGSELLGGFQKSESPLELNMQSSVYPKYYKTTNDSAHVT